MGLLPPLLSRKETAPQTLLCSKVFEEISKEQESKERSGAAGAAGCSASNAPSTKPITAERPTQSSRGNHTEDFSSISPFTIALEG